jgi:hypothetical protein
MPIYCIDDGGDGSQTDTTQSASTLDWSKADASVADLISYDAAAFTTSGNIIYFGDDHNDPNKAANWTLTLPTSGLPVLLISADRTASTPTYKKGTGNQLSSLGGSYSVTLDGAVALYGMRTVAQAANINISIDSDELGGCYNCTFVPGANATVNLTNASDNGRIIISNCTIDLTPDGTSTRATLVLILNGWEIQLRGLTFVNAGYRTGHILQTHASIYSASCNISGCDFSGFTNGTACEILSAASAGGKTIITNCLTAATWTAFTGVQKQGGEAILTNVGPADAPTAMLLRNYFGDIVSSTSIYRTGGAAIEGDATAWLITTTDKVAESAPFYTPWIYGTVSSTGSKTFTCHITNDTADFTDAEVWLEVEYLKDADEAQWTLATDQRATITATPAAQTDDTTSVWVGLNDDSQGLADYMQSLAVTATIGKTGQYRARVAVGVASIAASRYFYLDPKITVS